MKKILERQKLLKLIQEEIQNLNSHITSKIDLVIKNVPTNKTVDPDSFSR